jgi:hypothetical protein
MSEVDLSVVEESPAEALLSPLEALPAEGDVPALDTVEMVQDDAPKAPFIPDFDSPEVQALREKMKSREQALAAEAMTLEEALGVIPIRIRGAQYYLQEPTVRQEYLLRNYLTTLETQTDDAEKADLQLVEAVRGFVCRYVPEKMDVVPITAEEAPEVLGRRSIRMVIRTIFGTGTGSPNA